MLILLLCAALYGTGFMAATLVSPRTNRYDRLIVSFPLGAGLYTLILFCLNQGLGLLLQRELLLYLLAALLAILGLVTFFFRRQVVREMNASRTPSGAPTPLSRMELVLLIALFTLLAVVGTIVPVWNWDTYSQYLPFAREVFMEKTIPTTASPAVVELVRAFPPGYKLLIASGYILYGDIVHSWARFLSPLYAGLVLLLLYRTGRRHLEFSREVVLGGLFLCVTLPLFFEFSIVPTGIICFCFCALATIYFIFEHAEAQKKGPLALAGIFLGLSYWTSYTGAVFIPCVFLLLVMLTAVGRFAKSEELRGLRLSLWRFFIIFSIAFGVCAPHLLRNYLLIGNPLYPALYEWFGGAWINDWSLEHLLPRVVPARSFYLRPRWEIFHEGFFITLLFFLSLLSWPWYRKKKILALALFCLFYSGFYLMFLTWPRSSGISTKLLLPMFIPATLFAGERLNRLFRKQLPLWQGVVILAAIPVWSFFMLKDTILSWELLRSPGALRFHNAIRLLWALCVDYDEILIWLGVAMCLFLPFLLRKKNPGLLVCGFLLGALSCRSFSEGLFQSSMHVDELARDRSYPFWNAAVLSWYLPEARWLERNLPEDAVIATYDNRTYIYPRRVLPLDSPPLWPIYQGMDIEECIELLHRHGATHLGFLDFLTELHPLAGMSPIFDKLGDPDYLPLIYRGPRGKEPGHELKVYKITKRRSAGNDEKEKHTTEFRNE